MRGGEGVAGPQPMNRAVNMGNLGKKLGRSNSIFNLLLAGCSSVLTTPLLMLPVYDF